MEIDPKLLKTKPVDPRPDLGGWSSHDPDYVVTCSKCKCYYIGNKRSWQCADCAYKLYEDYEAKPKVNVFKFTYNGSSYYDSAPCGVQCEIDNFWEYSEVGDSFTVTREIMTVEDYEKLPEFDGF